MAKVPTEAHSRLQSALADRYRVEREIGRGGMARVYLAHDLRHDRDVAIKVLLPELAASLGSDRFLREIHIEAGLQHPHILPLHDSGVAGGLPYYVMPYVAGETLRDRIGREKQLPIDDALRITREVADALEYAHQHNVVHRDIKPANILLSAGHAIVADFGVGRAITAAASAERTEPGLAVGTPEYMSPEQAAGDAAVDGRSDVYALACVLYEMLAGDPPFQGRTPRSVLARHLHDPPPSLRTIRPSVPMAVEAALQTALAKVPADRFATVAEFARALPGSISMDGPGHGPRYPRRRRRVTAAWAAAVGLAVGLMVWRFWSASRAPLDGNRVVVFPMSGSVAGAGPAGTGEGVATYIGYALEGTAPLRWLEGGDYLPASERSSAGGLPGPIAQRISRSQRARFYIDGSILAGPESVTVVLRLHDVAGDSILRRSGASAAVTDASIPKLGLQAVSSLLPSLLEPGRKVDLSALTERRPDAIANFLQGEREYRRMRFAAALDHYKEALRADSAMAIAAVKGAAAATWLPNSIGVADLVGAAFDARAVLPRRWEIFARGLSLYFVGAADSAVTYFRRAIDVDSTWSEAWMGLGESYYHLAPGGHGADSLAESAFERARRTDSSFTPPVFHLAEIALRRGDSLRAKTLLRRLLQADPDSVYSRALGSMVDCATRGAVSVNWTGFARKAPTEALGTALGLAARGAYPACARDGFRAVLQSSSTAEYWGTLLGLQSLLAAMGRSAELAELLAWGQRAGLPGRGLYLMDAAAGAGFEAEARALVTERGRLYDSMPSPNLWLLGEWEAHHGDLASVRAIEHVTRRRAATSGTRGDSLFARIMLAQLKRAEGDTAGALALLGALAPSASPADLLWQPWEALARERLDLAELLLAKGRPAEADRVASELDNHRAVAYLVYLPAMLALRERAAASLGRRDLAATYRARLAALRRGAPAGSPSGT
ncbi:MAG: protein kinase [Gemmatimonadales bacterium]|nr:protein kinase [Gemmatimonadales bacterium]